MSPPTPAPWPQMGPPPETYPERKTCRDLFQVATGYFLLCDPARSPVIQRSFAILLTVLAQQVDKLGPCVNSWLLSKCCPWSQEFCGGAGGVPELQACAFPPLPAIPRPTWPLHFHLCRERLLMDRRTPDDTSCNAGAVIPLPRFPGSALCCLTHGAPTPAFLQH